MRHGYVDIPTTPEPLQGLFWERQRIAEDLRLASEQLSEANRAYQAVLLAHLAINKAIFDEESKRHD